jgi:Family of unknown function (DUF6114)/zinc-ribbon domain
LGDKPTAAMVLSLIGGIFVIFGGATLAFAGSLISSLSIAGAGSASSTLLALGLVGVIFGIIMIVGGVMMYSNPKSHTMWGAIVLVLSILSWVTAIGGYVIGFILGLIGGILALVFKPSMAPGMISPQAMGSMPTGSMGSGQPMGSMGMGMTCKNCGASIPAGATRCPSCGAAV